MSISLTDRHAAAVDTELAAGDYASVSAVIRAALREFFDRPLGPSLAQVEADIVGYRAGQTCMASTKPAAGSRPH